MITAIGGLALAAAAYLWIGSFAVFAAGLVMAAFGTALTGPAARPDPAIRSEHLAFRQLATGVRSLRPGQVLTDPLTGSRLRAERDRGFLTLAVADPESPAGDSVVTRYPLTFLRIPMGPPLWRQVEPLHFPGREIRWRQAYQIITFDMETGASDLTVTELAEVLAMLLRSAGPPRPTGNDGGRAACGCAQSEP